VSTDAAPASSTSTTQVPGAPPLTSPAGAGVTSPSVPETHLTTSTAPAARTDPGNLVYPDNISASYPVPAGGGVTATATWSGSPTLSLGLTCPSGHVARSGPSGLSISLPVPAGAPGMCTVSISETPSLPGTVSYVLVIGTPSG